MGYLVFALIMLTISFLAGAFLAGICAVLNAGDEIERELDDIEQAEYLREWKEKRSRRS